MAGEHLKMGLGFSPEWETAKFIITIFDELSQRLGFSYEYAQYPPSRLSLLTESGELDGELFKTYAYGESRSYLSRVPTSYISQTLEVYSSSQTIRIETWEDMSEYTLALKRGIQAIEGPVALYLNEADIVGLNDMVSCVSFVEKGRADLTVLSDFIANQMKHEGNLNLHLVGKLDEIEMYFYLGSSYDEYIPLIDETLRQMKDEGFF